MSILHPPPADKKTSILIAYTKRYKEYQQKNGKSIEVDRVQKFEGGGSEKE
jgi:hypothetical protein